MAAEGMPFPWRWSGGTISTNSDAIWVMSAKFEEANRPACFVHQQSLDEGD
jgi:hypothetical protein